MEEIIQVEDQHYILATSRRPDERSRVLKHGETFVVFDRFGDIRPFGLSEEGLYHEGTRFLNRLTLRIHARQPLLLGSSVRADNVLLATDLTNPDLFADGRIVFARDNLHVLRGAVLWGGTLFMRARVRNYSGAPADVRMEVSYGADFVDVFEVRGEKRPRRGVMLPTRVADQRVELAYRGLDSVTRRTRLEFSPPPLEVTESRARLVGTIEPHGEQEFRLTVHCESSAEESVRPSDGDRTSPVRFDEALERHTKEMLRSRAGDARVRTSNPQFNEWLRRSAADMHLLVTRTAQGPYPYAGIPWFCTPFGRDGIITAFEYLWVNPELARGVLRFLAANQADREDPERDEEPGKIIHEIRLGEMAALGEIPFGRYYGSVDATPLFVMLAGAYYERTGDRATLDTLWPNIEGALQWMERYGDADGDGFIEYKRHSRSGLTTQGWKDSYDSVFHADGTLAEAPIALCEVQGYAYAAWLAGAELARLTGRVEMAEDLSRRAARLQLQFEQAFWLQDLSTYALALDGQKRPCRVRTSNPGHCLFSKIASPERAVVVARGLLDESMFTQWGVRTVADTAVRYNPMSYHNGSIWPHDNAIFGYGLGRYGLGKLATRILDGLFGASLSMDLRRMPELFCGFPRRPGQGPTLYPVACLPQAWAAGSVFMLLQGCLGLSIDVPGRTVRLFRPALPASIGRATVSHLRVGSAVLDLVIHRERNDVDVHIRRRRGDVQVVVTR